MTMSSAVSKVTLNGDGSQTSWPFSFKVWKADDLEVAITNADGDVTVVSNWSVSLVTLGGTVTYPTSGSPLPSGHKITIRRSMDFLQDVDLVSGTRWDPEVVETALDQATAERQQLKEELSRAIKVDVSGTQTPDELLASVFGAKDAAAVSAGASASSAAAAANSADQAEAAASLVGVLTSSGTLLAGNDTITTPWAYNYEEGALSVYLGGVRQTKSSLTFVDAHTVQVGSTFSEDVQYDVVTVTLDGESTLTSLRDDSLAAKALAETARDEAEAAQAAAELAEAEAGSILALTYKKDNILGTVSQSGGVPTGAVIERGSNTNGKYVRFADGTQICTHRFSGILYSTSSGSIFTSGDTIWTFPANFIYTTVAISGLPDRNAGGAGVIWLGNNDGDTTTTAANFRILGSANFITAGINITAIGRWF